MRRAKLVLRGADMNKTEARFAAWLDLGIKQGQFLARYFEDFTLRLGNDCRYTPDFAALCADGSLRFYEVKGFWRDDARVKIKVAASKFPMFEFFAVKWVGGTWDVEVIKV
jgi:hypothetical protein